VVYQTQIKKNGSFCDSFMVGEKQPQKGREFFFPPKMLIMNPEKYCRKSESTSSKNQGCCKKDGKPQ
jgi:hypothetical protein